jgi:hypothetical protein
MILLIYIMQNILRIGIIILNNNYCLTILNNLILIFTKMFLIFVKYFFILKHFNKFFIYNLKKNMFRKYNLIGLHK